MIQKHEGPATGGNRGEARKRETPQIHSTENDALLQEINRRFKSGNRKLAPALLDIVRDLRPYWPLTVRQVYYRAVAALLIPNEQNEYKKVSGLLTTLRVNNLLDWDSITDRTRNTIDKRGVSNLAAYLRDEFYCFLNPEMYQRCLIQEQPTHIEVTLEKDALASVVKKSLWMFCVRINVIKGQDSTTHVQEMATRFTEAHMKGKRLIMLHFGDLDPSGMAIPRSIVKRIRKDHGVAVELIRAGLIPEQVIKHDIPTNPEAAKKKDSNYKKWLEEFGPNQSAVELDALHPEQLGELARCSMEELLDMHDYHFQIVEEKRERETLQEIRWTVEDFLKEQWPEHFGTSPGMGGADHG